MKAGGRPSRGVFQPDRRVRWLAARSLPCLVALLALTCLGLTCLAGGASAQSFVGRRGISIHNAMNWGVTGPDKLAYVERPFESEPHRLSPPEIEAVKRAGFDFVRLTLDPGPFLQFEGKARDGLDETLTARIRELLSAGLNVIVDFHPNTQVAAYAPDKLLRTASPEMFGRFVATVGRTAGLLRPFDPARVAIEPMNEPNTGYTPQTERDWQLMMTELYRAARSAAPEHTVVVTGGQGSDIKGLVKMEPAAFGANTLFTFHFYEPFLFTHQSVASPIPQAFGWRYVSALPYPATGMDAEALWAAASARANADTKASAAQKLAGLAKLRNDLQDYGTAGTVRSVAAAMDRVAAWAGAHRIATTRILLGEFGVTRTYSRYRGALDSDRKNWLGDIRTEAERRGFRWAYWNLKGYGGMAMQRQDGQPELDDTIVQALGLPGRRQ